MNLKSFFKQQITFWQKTGIDGYGKPSFSSPVFIVGRWQDQKMIFKKDGVKELLFGTVLYTEQEINIGDYVAIGSFVGLDPLLITTAKEVKTVSKSSDISGRSSFYSVFLKEK